MSTVAMSSDDEEVSPKAKAGSRVMKFISSKTAGSKLGRKVIMQVVGEDGEVMFNAIKDAAKLHFGPKKGKDLKADILKMILKVQIMVDGKQVTIENTELAQEPSHLLLFRAQMAFNNPNEKRDPCALSKALWDAGNMWLAIVKPFMQKKNQDKFTQIIAMLSDVEFLDDLLNGAEYMQFRSTISASITKVMSMASTDVRLQCKVSDCCQDALCSRGLFRSDGYCIHHHREKYELLIQRPTLHQFLLLEKGSQFFVEYLNEMKDDRGLSLFHFLKALEDFKTTSSQKLRCRSASVIAKKFMHNGAPSQLPIESSLMRHSLEKIDEFDQDNPRISSSFFVSIEDAARMKLSDRFNDGFIKSQSFERFVKAFTVPSELQALP